MAPEGVDVYVKVEAANPTGSVKDRFALGVIEWALAHGELKPGQTVVEASSGNTGIGLAMVCAVKGHPFVCVMSEAFSIERRKLMRFLGAKVVLTNPAHKASGIHHFNYGPGSPFNRKQTIQNFDLHNRHLLDQYTEPNPKLVVDYGKAKVSLFEHTIPPSPVLM
jgi:cysteine synthase